MQHEFIISITQRFIEISALRSLRPDDRMLPLCTLYQFFNPSLSASVSIYSSLSRLDAVDHLPIMPGTKLLALIDLYLDMLFLTTPKAVPLSVDIPPYGQLHEGIVRKVWSAVQEFLEALDLGHELDVVYRGGSHKFAKPISVSCVVVDVFGQDQLLFRAHSFEVRYPEPGHTHILQALHVVLLRKDMHGDGQLGWVEAALLCFV